MANAKNDERSAPLKKHLQLPGTPHFLGTVITIRGTIVLPSFTSTHPITANNVNLV
jgi:hypothetical protein